MALTSARVLTAIGFSRVTSAGVPRGALLLSDTLCLDGLLSSGTGLTRQCVKCVQLVGCILVSYDYEIEKIMKLRKKTS